jgi:very-short-patch-repair endonuclease
MTARWSNLPSEKPPRKKVKLPKPPNEAEERFALHLTAARIPFKREYRFCSSRRWKFDFALVEHKIAVEIEGGLYTQGRHTRPKGYIADMEKYRSAVYLGWTVLRFPPEEIKAGTAILEVVGFLETHYPKRPA